MQKKDKSNANTCFDIIMGQFYVLLKEAILFTVYQLWIMWSVCNLELLCRLCELDMRKAGWSVSMRSLDWFTPSDLNGLHNRFPYVSHIGPRFTGLERSQSTIWFWQRKSGLCLWDVCIWTWFCSCVNTSGQLAIICFQRLLQRMSFPFQFPENSSEVTLSSGPTRHSWVCAVQAVLASIPPRDGRAWGWSHQSHPHT